MDSITSARAHSLSGQHIPLSKRDTYIFDNIEARALVVGTPPALNGPLVSEYAGIIKGTLYRSDSVETVM
uniref:Uncharacterized protein n=1 Tax=Anguilla anguilla TaxID=7936 RepID=A0A0E9THF6_ANGAN